jgi:hypothetical protein
MKLAKTIAIGVAAFGLAAGSALAGEDSFEMDTSETFVLREPAGGAYDVYGIDENRDGVIDGYLFLEESDTLA